MDSLLFIIQKCLSYSLQLSRKFQQIVNISNTTPIPTKTAVSPHLSANIPARGKSRIIAMEKNMLFTEIKVARCLDGISLFSSSDCTG